MKTIKNTLAVTAVLLAASCSQKNLEPLTPTTSETITIEASFENTKTALADNESGTINWQPGDEIAIFCNKVGGKFTSTLTAPAATSSFSGTLNVVTGFGEESDPTQTLYGLSPYSASASSDGSSITTTLPTVQVATADSYDPTAYITVGKTDTRAMAFYAVGGGIRFTVSRDDIERVVLNANNSSESLAGTIKITIGEDKTPTTTQLATAKSNAVILKAAEGEKLIPGTWYYISTLPLTLTEGFTLTMYAGKYKGEKVVSSEVTISRKTFGSMTNIDNGIEFKEMSWSAPTIINTTAVRATMEINPVTKEPVIAAVTSCSASSSYGPIYVYNGLTSTPSAVLPEGEYCKEIQLGVDANGSAYVYASQPVSPRKGHIYTSDDFASWSCVENIDIDQTNSYVGSTIACLNSEVFVMTCNNGAGAVSKRMVNTTKYNGTSWSTGLADIPADGFTSGRIYPTLLVANNELYCFVTNYTKGCSILKYDSTNQNWSNIITVDATTEPYKKYTYGVYSYQGFAVDNEGYIYLALGVGSSPNYGVAVLCVSPDGSDVSQIGENIPLTNSISARYARIAASATGDIILAYRDNDECLHVTKLQDDFETWGNDVKLTNSTCNDVRILFNADNEAYVMCSTAGHLEVFKSL